MTMIRGGGDISWPENRSTHSDDGVAAMLHTSSLWSTNATSMTRLDTGQLSPVSTELDMSLLDSCAVPNMVHSATSSCTHDSWGTNYSEGADGDDVDQDLSWDQDSDDVLAIPKLEPVEDEDFHMAEVKEVPRATQPSPGTADAAPKAKRPRGRPRKHPLAPQTATCKVAKGRSKTGCITCRKRKKKCDEAKPRCMLLDPLANRHSLTPFPPANGIQGMNCEKNAVVCEGYNEKTLWKSGKERAADGTCSTSLARRMFSDQLPQIDE